MEAIQIIALYICVNISDRLFFSYDRLGLHILFSRYWNIKGLPEPSFEI